MITFPEWCLSMRCIDCDSHAIVNGKLCCNYMNRLGLSKEPMKAFIDSAETPEKLEAVLKDTEEKLKMMQEEIKRLEELKKKYGGAKSEEKSSS